MLKKPNRNNDAEGADAPPSERSWDFAIAIPWRPGWHVTLFPLGLLTVVGAIVLVALALIAAIWFL